MGRGGGLEPTTPPPFNTSCQGRIQLLNHLKKRNAKSVQVQGRPTLFKYHSAISPGPPKRFFSTPWVIIVYLQRLSNTFFAFLSWNNNCLSSKHKIIIWIHYQKIQKSFILFSSSELIFFALQPTNHTSHFNYLRTGCKINNICILCTEGIKYDSIILIDFEVLKVRRRKIICCIFFVFSYFFPLIFLRGFDRVLLACRLICSTGSQNSCIVWHHNCIYYYLFITKRNKYYSELNLL